MKINSSLEYATRLMVALARSYGQSPVAAEKLSVSEGVPSDYVNQLLLKLKRGGLLQSQRGSAGGYTLSHPPEAVTLGQVARAIDGEIFEGVCDKYNQGEKDCHHQSHCSISPVWQKLGLLIQDYFDGLTLAQIMEDEPGACGRVAAMLDNIPSQKV